MDAAIHRRVERTISECRTLGIDPNPRTVAEIMVDEDIAVQKYESLSSERAIALDEYEQVAARVTEAGSPENASRS
jgi:hypothetical protein